MGGVLIIPALRNGEAERGGSLGPSLSATLAESLSLVSLTDPVPPNPPPPEKHGQQLKKGGEVGIRLPHVHAHT